MILYAFMYSVSPWGGGDKAYTKSLYYYLISILVGVSMEVISHVPPRSSPYTT